MDVPGASTMQTGRNRVVRHQKQADNTTLDFQQQDVMNNVLVPNDQEAFENHLAANHDNVLGELDTMVNQFAEQHQMAPIQQQPNQMAPINQQAPTDYVDQTQQATVEHLNEGKHQNKGAYHIMDLFWLVNEKLCVKDCSVDEGEAQFVTISFNMDFGNLRVTYYEVPPGAIQGTVVFQQSLKKLVVGTIYPASCFKLMNMGIGEMVCMEQLITNTNEQWQKERPWCKIAKGENNVKLTISDPASNISSWFNFTNWQLASFLHACKFVYKEGFKLHGQNIITNR